jgi:hypothetical protein
LWAAHAGGRSRPRSIYIRPPSTPRLACLQPFSSSLLSSRLTPFHWEFGGSGASESAAGSHCRIITSFASFTPTPSLVSFTFTPSPASKFLARVGTIPISASFTVKRDDEPGNVTLLFHLTSLFTFNHLQLIVFCAADIQRRHCKDPAKLISFVIGPPCSNRPPRTSPPAVDPLCPPYHQPQSSQPLRTSQASPRPLGPRCTSHPSRYPRTAKGEEQTSSARAVVRSTDTGVV